jgi:hypothetical protein
VAERAKRPDASDAPSRICRKKAPGTDLADRDAEEAEQRLTALQWAGSSAEILEASDMARVAYDAAKSAGRRASAKQDHDTVLPEVYRAQVDALMIEARAKMRFAEEYDAAQERGDRASDHVSDRLPSFREAHAIGFDQQIGLVMGQQSGKHGLV